MEVSTAHDIVNKEINVILKEIDNRLMINEINKKDIKVGDRHTKMTAIEDLSHCNKIIYECANKLKGIISMEASEIERWEYILETYDLKNFFFKQDIEKNIQALKISMNDLKERVK